MLPFKLVHKLVMLIYLTVLTGSAAVYVYLCHNLHSGSKKRMSATFSDNSNKFIIIIIKYIYIAQDQEAAHALGYSYKWNRNVLSLFLNIASVMSGVHSSAGRLFHTQGP